MRRILLSFRRPSPRGLMIVLAFVSCAGAGSVSTAAVERGWNWHETLTPHFVIKHQASWLPPGFSMGAERVYFRLRMDLGMFSPWMSKCRVNLFVYADHESYLAGEFRPPRWSNGLSVYERKTVVLTSMKNPHKLLSLMAHETTHLFFESYWREQRRAPPAWLGEGLAMIEEADSQDQPETSGWYQQMTLVELKRFPALDTFFRRASPAKDLHNNRAAVGEWYVQAYSVTYFLLRKHSRLQFKSLCGHLRDGRPVAAALWLSYRYRSVADLDTQWRNWLVDPIHKRRVAARAVTANEGSQRREESEEVAGKTGLRGFLFNSFLSGFGDKFKWGQLGGGE